MESGKVAITNVLDTPDSYAKNGTEVSDVYITFQREQPSERNVMTILR